MNKDTKDKLLDLINYVKDKKEYQQCILLKEKMSNNEEITKLISYLKTLQKQYVKSNYQDKNLEGKLKLVEEKLNTIPIYIEYNQNLEVINNMLDIINEDINKYFLNKFNIMR